MVLVVRTYLPPPARPLSLRYRLKRHTRRPSEQTRRDVRSAACSVSESSEPVKLMSSAATATERLATAKTNSAEEMLASQTPYHHLHSSSSSSSSSLPLSSLEKFAMQHDVNRILFNRVSAHAP